MIPGDQHIWLLSKCGDQNLGLACTEDGLFLGRTPLAERRGGFHAVRPKGDLQRLLNHAYGAEIAVERLLPGLATVASALSRDNLCLAQIAAVQLRLPDLPDAVTRARVEAEDLLIKRGQGTSWNDAEHPRTGTPPNPGWFAPKPGWTRGCGQRKPRREEEAGGSRRTSLTPWGRAAGGLGRPHSGPAPG